ncbi:MAG: nuclease [Micavibrio sp.]|nr:MAG: nuclease [Micavibrio sp.]
MNEYYVYILSNKYNNVVYIGISNNIERRLSEHKSHDIPGFSKKYNLDKLVYYECFSSPAEAIGREKQLKGWVRRKKDALIEKENPDWRDLSVDWYSNNNPLSS